jgi:hypothetical protein
VTPVVSASPNPKSTITVPARKNRSSPGHSRLMATLSPPICAGASKGHHGGDAAPHEAPHQVGLFQYLQRRDPLTARRASSVVDARTNNRARQPFGSRVGDHHANAVRVTASHERDSAAAVSVRMAAGPPQGAFHGFQRLSAIRRPHQVLKSDVCCWVLSPLTLRDEVDLKAIRSNQLIGPTELRT